MSHQGELSLYLQQGQRRFHIIDCLVHVIAGAGRIREAVTAHVQGDDPVAQ
jgi:hypothetical protein